MRARRAATLLRDDEREPAARAVLAFRGSPPRQSPTCARRSHGCWARSTSADARRRPTLSSPGTRASQLNLVAKSARAMHARAGRRGRHHHHGAPFEPHPLAAGVPGGGRDARLPLSGRRGRHHARGDRRRGRRSARNRRLRARVERARRGESRLRARRRGSCATAATSWWTGRSLCRTCRSTYASSGRISSPSLRTRRWAPWASACSGDATSCSTRCRPCSPAAR